MVAMPRLLPRLSTVGAFVVLVLLGPLLVAAPGPAGTSAVAGSAAGVEAAPRPRADRDDDGLLDRLETRLHTDPDDPDSDHDTIRDGGDPDIVAVVVRGTPGSAYRLPRLRKVSLHRLAVAEQRLLSGDVTEARQLLRALRTRVDGCPRRADRDDWIVQCQAQRAVRRVLGIVIRNRVTTDVDPTVGPAVEEIPGLDSGASRTVAAARAPDGRTESFVADEVVLHPESRAELADFLQRYGGTVLRDGTPMVLPSSDPDPSLPSTTGWYLVRIDPSLSPLDDLAAGMELAGLRGRWSFSSEEAARVVALMGRETSLDAAPNLLGDTEECVVCENPDGAGFLDASTWWWMSEDDDAGAPGDQGLSTGVVHAWQYLRYQGYPPISTPFPLLRLAVVDGGFDLNPTTGVGNADYAPNPPLQVDRVDGDFLAGGAGYGFENCNGCWHGQMTFGVSAAQPNNRFGSAGTSGGLARPVLIRIGPDFATIAAGVSDAVYNGAQVISLSIGADCGYLCKHYGGGDQLEQAVDAATALNRVVVAAAGNAGDDLAGVDRYPCELDGVICVGGIHEDRTPLGSYGTSVDMYAPTCVRTTVVPGSQDTDGTPPNWDGLAMFCGTSASAPFLAGVVALVKMLAYDVTANQVRQVLLDTANPSTEPKIGPTGYVDAFRALLAVRPNLPPTVSLTQPAPGPVPYQNVTLQAAVGDPEWAGPYAAEFPVTVRFTSSVDGLLCEASGVAAHLGCEADHLSLGVHQLTATVTDAFGQTAHAVRTVTVADRPPVPTISYPTAGSTFYTSQSINLHGTVYDPDEAIPDGALEWRSDRDGLLATGRDAWVHLSTGAHVITLTARDSLGATGTATVHVIVQTGAGYPTVMITRPTTSPANVTHGQPIVLEGRADDPEDGVLPGSGLVWTSDVDGYLGTGAHVTVTLSGRSCTSVLHTVTLTATDSDGHHASHSVQVAVLDIC